MHLKWGGNFCNVYIQCFLRKSTVKKILKSVNFWLSYDEITVWVFLVTHNADTNYHPILLIQLTNAKNPTRGKTSYVLYGKQKKKAWTKFITGPRNRCNKIPKCQLLHWFYINEHSHWLSDVHRALDSRSFQGRSISPEDCPTFASEFHWQTSAPLVPCKHPHAQRQLSRQQHNILFLFINLISIHLLMTLTRFA